MVRCFLAFTWFGYEAITSHHSLDSLNRLHQAAHHISFTLELAALLGSPILEHYRLTSRSSDELSQPTLFDEIGLEFQASTLDPYQGSSKAVARSGS